MLKFTDKGILLCCGKDKCPEVILQDEQYVTITDDDGNTVKLEVSQAELLGTALEQLQSKK